MRKFGSTYLTSWSCDFDTVGDLCGMWNDGSNAENWTQRIAMKSDTVANRGIGLEKTSSGSRAKIWSPTFEPGIYCVRFRVFAILTDEADHFVSRMWEYVHSRARASGSGSVLLWRNTLTALKNNSWTLLEFNRRNKYADVFMQLEFNLPYFGARSSVVLDDVSVEMGTCKPQ